VYIFQKNILPCLSAVFLSVSMSHKSGIFNEFLFLMQNSQLVFSMLLMSFMFLDLIKKFLVVTKYV